VRTSATNSINFAVNSFWSDVVSRGYGQRSWYMTSVQAGFEPWVNGTGLAVNNFSYSLSGVVSPPPSSPPPSSRPPSSPPPTTGGGNGGGSCHVTYTKNEWAGGFVASVTISNPSSSTINGWTLGFTFPGDQKITSGWSATYSQNGKSVTATAMEYNRSIAPGQNTNIGFQGTWASSDANPSSFTLNGTACS